MPAQDRIYRMVKAALLKDGWTITHDPYWMDYDGENLFVDLGAERPLAAERGDSFIAVEIKSFLGASPMRDFQEALGQYQIYQAVLQAIDPDRKLYLAVSDATFSDVFQRSTVQLIQRQYRLSILIVDIVAEEVVRWIN